MAMATGAIRASVQLSANTKKEKRKRRRKKMAAVLAISSTAITGSSATPVDRYSELLAKGGGGLLADILVTN